MAPLQIMKDQEGLVKTQRKSSSPLIHVVALSDVPKLISRMMRISALFPVV